MFKRKTLSIAIGIALTSALSTSAQADCASSGSTYHFCLETGSAELTTPEGNYSGEDYGILGPQINNLGTVEVDSNATFTGVQNTGISVFANNVIVRNFGDISNTGGNAIRGSGTNTVTIENDGALTNLGQDGIEGHADTVLITNTGSIEGVSGNGIGLVGSIEAAIVNSGHISGTGYNGVEIHGSNMSVTNNGVIEDVSAHGVEIFRGGDAIFINNGDIAAGASGASLYRQTGNVNFQNNGNITGGSYGVDADLTTTASLSIVNNGSIVNSGSAGIKVSGNSNTAVSIVNTGVIGAADLTGAHSSLALDFTATATPFVFSNNGGSIFGAVLGGSSSGDSISLNGGQIAGLVGGVETLTLSDTVYLYGVDIVDRDGHGLSVNNSGHIVVQEGLNISGDYFQADNSVMEVLINDGTSFSDPIVDILGTATFGTTSKIKLSPESSQYTPGVSSTTYNVLQAATLVGANNIEVFSDSILIDVESFSIENNHITAIVSAIDAGDLIQQNLGEVSSAVLETASAAQSAILANPDVPVDDAVRVAFEASAEAGVIDLAEFVEALSPDISGQVATGSASFTQAAVSNIGGRVDSVNRGISSGDLFSQSGFWIKGFHSNADQDERDSIKGFSAHSTGISIGVDGRLRNNSLLGVAFSYGDTDVDTDNSSNDTEINSYLLSLYGAQQFGEYSVDGVISYGLNDNLSKRYVSGTEAKADYEGDQLSFSAQISRGYALDERWSLTPKVLFSYSHIDIESYQEQGSTAALYVGGQKYEELTLGAGAKLTYSLNFAGGILIPEVEVLVLHDFAGDQIESTNRFVSGGPSFVTTGADPEKNSFLVSLGATHLMGDSLAFSFRYELQSADDYRTETLVASARYDF